MQAWVFGCWLIAAWISRMFCPRYFSFIVALNLYYFLQVHIVQRGAVRPLIEMLQSPDVQLREMSAFALGRLAQVSLFLFHCCSLRSSGFWWLHFMQKLKLTLCKRCANACTLICTSQYLYMNIYINTRSYVFTLQTLIRVKTNLGSSDSWWFTCFCGLLTTSIWNLLSSLELLPVHWSLVRIVLCLAWWKF